jgi:pilus assembly protein CpaF
MSNIELPIRAIREMVASAVHLVIHTSRLPDGSRKVMSVSELVGLKQETEVEFRDLFVFRQGGVAPDGAVLGEFMATGAQPTFLQELKMKGIPINEAIFQPGEVRVG